MTHFDAAQHPRGQVGNAGQFTAKHNSAPSGLIGGVAEVPVPSQVRGMTDEELAMDIITNSRARAVHAPDGDFSDFGIALTAVRIARTGQELPPTEYPHGHRLEHSLDDVREMGGDEIRAMTADQRRHLHSAALESAARLQEYLDELGEEPAAAVRHTRVINLDEITEKEISDVWNAAAAKGARGVLRTHADFCEFATDQLAARALTDTELEAAWDQYLAVYISDYEEAAASPSEYRAFSSAVERSLRDVAPDSLPAGAPSAL